MVEMMGYFREWLAAVSFASFLGSRVEQLVKWNHCFVGSVGRVGFLGSPSLWNPQILCQWGDAGFPVAVPAKCTCVQPWHGGELCCNKHQPAHWAFHCPVQPQQKHRASSWQIWCFPLSGDAGFNYTVSCRGNVALSSLCTVGSSSCVGGCWVQAHCSWTCQPGTEDGNLSNFCNFWEAGNFADCRENTIAGLSKHQLCVGGLARKSLPPIYSWKYSQVFNTVLDFWLMNRECKENFMWTCLLYSPNKRKGKFLIGKQAQVA